MDRLLAVLWGAALALVLRDERTLLGLAGGARPRGDASVTAIVPARDEERDVGETLGRLAAQDHPDLQVVAVDDESRDGTRAAMAAVAGVEVVDGAPLPAGWTGKPWACAQGVRRARGIWLLFLDADVRLAPGAVAAAVALAEELRVEALTAFPRLETGTAIERAVLPLAAVLMQTAVIPSWAARSPRTDLAIGVGAFLLVRRDAYLAAGGHEAVRGEVVEDLALARNLKRAGHLPAWVRGEDQVRLRFYHGAGEMWRGWRKNAARAWTGPAPLAAAGGAAVAAVVLAPWARAFRSPWAAAALSAQLATLTRALRHTDAGPAWALGAPVGAVFLGAVAAASGWDRATGRGTDWRGRRVG
jgi:hypothetical protein